MRKLIEYIQYFFRVSHELTVGFVIYYTTQYTQERRHVKIEAL